MDPADIKLLLEQNAQLMKAQNEQSALILKLLAERDNSAGGAGVLSNSSNKEMLMSSLGARIESFRYMPEDDLTFESWWLRYGSVVEQDGSQLSEDAKVRLLVSKLQTCEFNRFCDAVKPKGPYDSSLPDTLSTLKSLFTSTKSLFMKRYECFQLKQKVGQDILQFGATVNGSCESAKPPIGANALKCLVFLSGLHSDFHELRIKCLQKLEAAESENKDLKLDELLEECKKHLTLKENVRSLNKQFNSLSTNAVGPLNSRKQFKPKNPIKPAGYKNKHSSRTSSRLPRGVCWRCGGEDHISNCKFAKLRCNNCGKSGHADWLCRSRPKEPVFRNSTNAVNTENSKIVDNDVNMDISNVFLCTNSSNLSAPWYVSLQVRGLSIKLFVDSGSSTTLLTEATWREIGKPSLESVKIVGKSFTGHTFHAKGKCSIQVQYKNEPMQEG